MIPDQTEPLIYKLITLKNLAAYWNPYDSFLQYSSIQEMRELMEILVRELFSVFSVHKLTIA